MANDIIDVEKPEAQAVSPGPKVITLSLQGGAGSERKVFRLHKDRIVIGSVVSADVRLAGEGVAPIHAVLEMDSRSGKGMIYDLASETGVFINNQKVVAQPVQSGDRLRIGGHELSLSVDELADLLPRERTREGSDGRKLFLDPHEDLAPLLLEEQATGVGRIFDYRPTQKRALEVVMSWRGTILDVEHFVKERQVTVGTTRRSDFGIPPFLSRSPYAIVTREGEDFTLNLDPKMKGVIQRQGKLQSLGEIRGPRLPILDNDFAKVSIGEVDFYLSYTAAPPRLRRSRILDRDPFFYKILASSLALTALLIGALINIDVPPEIEAEQIPDRLATILYQPEKYQEKVPTYVADVERSMEARPVPKPEPPKAKPIRVEPRPVKTAKIDLGNKPVHELKEVPKEMNVSERKTVKTVPQPKPVPPAKTPGMTRSQHQSVAKEGEGARAAGPEGTRGSKRAAPGNEHQTAAMRPSPVGGHGRGSGNSQIQDEGNVDILKGAAGKIEDILGNSAANLGKGGEKLKGFGGFSTEGNGGLALSGGGRGGGGDAESLGGLGKTGRGGGRIGTGLGAAGSGSGIIGALTRVPIRTGGPEEAVVMGAIDADAVEAALLAHKDEFRLCYEKEINAENPNLSGRVGTTFVIGSTGRVTQAGIESTTLHNANTEHCVLTVIKRIQFPIPRGASLVQVSYPFKFNKTGR